MLEGGWQTEVYGDHPLVGRIWSTRDGRFIQQDALLADLRTARYVLIGEQHDHADHHRLQALILKGLAKTPIESVAFEMLNEDVRAGVPLATDVALFEQATNWAKSGWPDFKLYRPIFDVIFKHGLRIEVAHPNRDTLRSVFTDGLTPWPPEQIKRLALDRPIDAQLQTSLEAQIRKEHCGYAPEKIVKPMALAQNVKDAWMARALVDAAGDGARALIAGNGHIRRDRGVPLYLARHDQRPIRSVALQAVHADTEAPGDYHPERFDFIIFTPRVDDIDPCVRFKEQLEKMRKARQ
jgi:uncharacterized iron-regulated protein